MTCKELHEQITAYVDDRVDEQTYRARMAPHIKDCPDCRQLYETEILSKFVVAKRGAAKRDAISGTTPRSTIDPDDPKITRDAASQTSAPAGFLDRLSGRIVSPIGVVLAIAVIAASAYLMAGGSFGESVASESKGLVSTGETTAKVAPNRQENFLNQASKNFEAIMNKKFGVAFETKDAAELGNYFNKEGVAIAPHVLPVRGATLLGGMVSEHAGNRHFPHWVYSDGETVLYFFEVPVSDLRSGDVFYLTPDALERLATGERIWQTIGGGQVMVAYQTDNVVIAMVGNAEQGDLKGMVPGL